MSSRMGRAVARPTNEAAGKGCWRKRRPSCNEADSGSKFAAVERGQTSNESIVTRAFEKS